MTSQHMTAEVENIVNAVKEHAQDNYEGGWDVIVESWSDADIAQVIVEDTILCAEDAIAQFSDFLAA